MSTKGLRDEDGPGHAGFACHGGTSAFMLGVVGTGKWSDLTCSRTRSGPGCRVWNRLRKSKNGDKWIHSEVFITKVKERVWWHKFRWL